MSALFYINRSNRKAKYIYICIDIYNTIYKIASLSKIGWLDRMVDIRTLGDVRIC